jgi:hypothetical protein
MNYIFHKLISKIVEIYIDDVVVKSKSYKEHLKMAANQVWGGYPRVSGPWVSVLVLSFHPWICGFAYPKPYGFGADS